MLQYLALMGAQLASSYQQAQLIQRSGDIKAQVDEMNAKYAELDAFNATKEGYTQAARAKTQEIQVAGAQRAAEAGAGQAVGYGTAAGMEADVHTQGAMNVLELQREGAQKAMGLQNQAINARVGGSMAQAEAGMQAGAAITSGFLNAAKTGISGYEFDNSSGKGNSSRAGDNNAPSWNKNSTQLFTQPTFGSSWKDEAGS